MSFVSSQDSLMSDRPVPIRARPVFTFQVQVLGTHGGLRGDLGIDLDRV